MINVVTTAQMQTAEKAADEGGLSYAQLMENAGQQAALVIEQTFDLLAAQVLVLVGPGNNGGDGLVIARHLKQAGAAVVVYVWRRENLDHDSNWQALDNTGVIRILSRDPDSQSRLTQLLYRSAIVVDALLGTGISRPISGPLADLLTQAKQAITTRRLPDEGGLIEPSRPHLTHDEIGPIVVAVDLPSGLHSDLGQADSHTLMADLTITFGAVKQGHILRDGPNCSGQLVVADIGLTPENYPPDVALQMVTGADVAAMLPARPATAHKGTFGRALLLAGSVNYIGAALLSAKAAIRSGVGWAMVACPQSIHSILASHLLEATYLPLPHEAEHGEAILSENLNRATAMLIGPGLGQDGRTVELLRLFLQRQRIPLSSVPLIIDADGLNILARQERWWEAISPYSILTPHPGEMARLMNCSISEVQAHRLRIAAQMAVKWQQVVLLKGAYSLIATPDGRTAVLPFANPALAKAGSGDVLAGIIVALRAQGLPPFEATLVGGYLHGLAGLLAREDLGATAVAAGDLVAALPTAIRELTGD